MIKEVSEDKHDLFVKAINKKDYISADVLLSSVDRGMAPGFIVAALIDLQRQIDELKAKADS